MNKCVRVFFLIGLFCLFAPSIRAQSTDLARIEFTYFPQRDSDNSFRRFKTFLNFPIKVGENESYLVPGVEYENINFKFIDDTPFQKRGELDRFQSFSLNLGYTFLLGEDWRFAAQGGAMFASNFETGKAIKDDLLYTGAVLFVKDRTGEDAAQKPWRLIAGLHYSTTSGFPFPLPIVNYYREFHPDWSFSIGVPKTNLKYSFNAKHHLQAFATLDGFFANIQENRLLQSTNEVAENISMTIILGGLGYEYNFTKHLVYYLYTGYTIMNDIRLRDDNKDDVYTINKSNTFYARSGIKFKI